MMPDRGTALLARQLIQAGLDVPALLRAAGRFVAARLEATCVPLAYRAGMLPTLEAVDELQDTAAAIVQRLAPSGDQTDDRLLQVRVLEQGVTIVVPSDGTAVRPKHLSPEFVDAVRAVHDGAVLVQPMVQDAHLLGALLVMRSREAGTFGEQDVAFVADAAGLAAVQLAGAVRHAALQDRVDVSSHIEGRLRARARQQAVVAALGQEALACMNLPLLLQEAARLVSEALDVPLSHVLEWRADEAALLLRAGIGWDTATVGEATVADGEASQAGYTLEMMEPIIVVDVRQEERFGQAPLHRDHGVVSGLSVPVTGREGVYGVLAAYDRRPRSFTRDDVHFLQAVANVLATAIAREEAEGELVEARDAAEEMARLKSSFLANMSHEIRTPLTSIIGFASVLAHDVEGGEKELAEIIEASGKRLLNLLNSVLDIAKLESRRVTIKAEPLDLEQEGREVIRLVTPLAEKKGLDLVFDVTDEGREALAILDKAALNRVLNNLIGNAIKFTEHGRVHVTLDADDSKVRFSIEDSGIGIDPAFLPYLFDEFRQESSGLDRTHQGSGLGLSITRRLVELMDGEVTVHSEKGEGSCFAVAFPRVFEAAARREQRREPEPVSHVPEEIRMLLVEDNLDTQFLLLELMDERYDLTVASSADEALRLARQERFHVVILDIKLGDGPSGLEILRSLRTMPDYQDVPIVALTAYALPGDRERFLEMGFTAYMSKPFEVDELMELPVRLLGGGNGRGGGVWQTA